MYAYIHLCTYCTISGLHCIYTHACIYLCTYCTCSQPGSAVAASHDNTGIWWQQISCNLAYRWWSTEFCNIKNYFSDTGIIVETCDCISSLLRHYPNFVISEEIDFMYSIRRIRRRGCLILLVIMNMTLIYSHLYIY